MLRRSSVVCEKTQSCPELLQFATGEMMGGGRQKELLLLWCWVGPGDSLEGTGRRIESRMFQQSFNVFSTCGNHLEIIWENHLGQSFGKIIWESFVQNLYEPM